MSEFDEAMKRMIAEMNAAPTEPCKHGELYSCIRCWNEAMQAWMPSEPGEAAPMFFGVMKEKP